MYTKRWVAKLAGHWIGGFLFSLVVLSLPVVSWANMSSTPWIHEIIQKGHDVEITLSIFENSSRERVLENWSSDGGEGVPFPDLSGAYKLERWGKNNVDIVFEDRVFSAEDAVSVTDYTCQYDEMGESVECDPEGDYCIDCDEDGLAECPGFCAVAYRFVVVDKCPEPGNGNYQINTRETETYMRDVLGDSNDGLGSTTFTVDKSNSSCYDESCSATAIGTGPDRSGLPIFVLIGVLLSAS